MVKSEKTGAKLPPKSLAVKDVGMVSNSVGDPVCPPTDVTAWLKKLGLERYASAFAEAGYEDLGYIAEMSLDDAMEIEGMKKPHAKRICKAACKLDSSWTN